MADERIIKPIAKTLSQTYEKDQNPTICSETGAYGNINTSQTLTRLIQETGRFNDLRICMQTRPIENCLF